MLTGILAGVLLSLLLFIPLTWWVMRRERQAAQREMEQNRKMAEQEARLEVERITSRLREETSQQKAGAEKELLHKEKELDRRESKLSAREENITREQQNLEDKNRELGIREKRIQSTDQQLQIERSELVKQLESLSGQSREDVLKNLKEAVAREAEDELRQYRQEKLRPGEREIEQQAQGILVDVLQRVAQKESRNLSATTVILPNDELKGRIIGKEGRNIKAFEAITGVTLMIDEVPGGVLISSFDPTRREVARIALEHLVKDGRIHPATIEEAVGHAQKAIDQTIIESAENVLGELGISGVAQEIVQLVGRLKFRNSFNQNTLDHSREVAEISALIACEMGLDPNLAKRAGIFHDMGKAVSSEWEGSHASVGAAILRKYGEHPAVINAVEAHHEEVPVETVYGGILMLADGLSASRPGARVESLELYLKRLENLERLASDIPGVSEAYALQAGRELRVIVTPEQVDEDKSRQLARHIRDRIEEELQYPSTIKVTVIREQRFTETAK